MYLFISYSSKDKEFVRKLDASLTYNGLEVFLDERDIKIGDSIPEKIYKGIERATHIIYVISGSSKESTWVKEELSVAKMRQKENFGCVILPVLIDETDIPTSVKHVKYADLTLWQDSARFIIGVNSILQTLGVVHNSLSDADISFFLENYGLLENSERFAERVSGYIDGATYCDFIISNREDHNRLDGVRVAVKNEIDRNLMIEEVGQLLRNAEASMDKNIPGLDVLIKSGRDMLDGLGHSSDYTPVRGKKSYEEYQRLQGICSRFAGVLRIYRNNVLSIVVNKKR